MPRTTDYLRLVLPGLGEFRDAWHEPINENFRRLESHVQGLDRALVLGGASSAYAALVGTKATLAERLNVSLDPDGRLILGGSPAIAELGSSATNGDDYDGDGVDDASPRARFDFADLEIWNARSPVPGERFLGAPTARGLLDDGLAHRARDRGAFDGAHPIASPSRLFVEGLVAGPDSFLAGAGPADVRFDAALGAPSTWPVFNIDGYLFRLRETVVLDVSTDVTGASLVDGDLVYLFVQRGGYASANTRVKKATDLGAAVAKDLRRLQSGQDGVISGKTFSAASAAFEGSPTKWTALPGDLLVIELGPARGRYVIGSVDGPTQLTIKGDFKADGLAGQAWAIVDDAHPNLGCVRVPNEATLPPYVPGRVYVGRGQMDAGGFRAVGGPPMTKIAFPLSGVFDSGWLAVTTASFPLTFEHNLGVVPTHIDVFVREIGGDAYPPVALRSIVVDFDTTNTTVDGTDPRRARLHLPSMTWRSSRQRAIVRLGAESPWAPPVLFTRDDDTHVTTGQMRLIARR